MTCRLAAPSTSADARGQTLRSSLRAGGPTWREERTSHPHNTLVLDPLGAPHSPGREPAELLPGWGRTEARGSAAPGPALPARVLTWPRPQGPTPFGPRPHRQAVPLSPRPSLATRPLRTVFALTTPSLGKTSFFVEHAPLGNSVCRLNWASPLRMSPRPPLTRPLTSRSLS